MDYYAKDGGAWTSSYVKTRPRRRPGGAAAAAAAAAKGEGEGEDVVAAA
jgi:hypothetical protein